MFLVIVTMFYLILDFFSLFGTNTWEDVGVSVILNAIILLYCMLPGVRSGFWYGLLELHEIIRCSLE